MSITIREHAPGSDLSDFIAFPHALFASDKAWIPPLDMEIRDRLNPKKNPFFEHGEARLFTAWRDGRIVGRISASVDQEHQRLHQDGAGFFGFFDTVDDQAVASALLETAAGWLRSRGAVVMRGPFSLSINEESGILVEGHEHPPVILMPHSARHQEQLALGAGLAPIKDLWAWKYVVEPPPKRAQDAWDEVTKSGSVRFRSVDKSRMDEEVRLILDIFNDAWKRNWGFVPATPSEAKKMATDLKLVLDAKLAFIAEVDGTPAAICVCLPNINEAMRDLRGKLFPFGFAKLLWRLKVKRVKSARLMLLGIRKEFRGRKDFGGLSMAMYVELYRRGVELGYEWAELGWTLEDNKLINLGIASMRAKVYKKYRVYERALSA